MSCTMRRVALSRVKPKDRIVMGMRFPTAPSFVCALMLISTRLWLEKTLRKEPKAKRKRKRRQKNGKSSPASSLRGSKGGGRLRNPGGFSSNARTERGSNGRARDLGAEARRPEPAPPQTDHWPFWGGGDSMKQKLVCKGRAGAWTTWTMHRGRWADHSRAPS